YSGNHYLQFVRGIHRDLNYFLPGDMPLAIMEETESVCAARYFRAHNKGAAGGTTIVMDIGGGTCDIAVWQHLSETSTPLIWQSSVRFAGQELVVEPIARNAFQLAGGSRSTSEGGSILEVLSRTPGAKQTDFSRAV